ncbi:hypothetical protein IMY05_001G0103900 [Salix suchowensis]|nr:hypothetical protein IMY05_001G0103900 [Salix suchowensis]
MTLTFDIWSSLQRHPRTAISTTVEDSDEEEEEDDEVDSHSCMEDEASASKFFFSSPMSYKGDEACLLMHESHALSNAQEALKNHVSCGDVVSETLKNHVGCSDVVSETLVKGKENLGAVTLSVGTIPLVVPFQSSPSKFNVKEHDGLTVVPARGKEKIGADVPSIQLSAAAGGSNGGCSSSSHAKEMDEASRPTNCGEQFRPNDMQVPSPLNESLDEQRVDSMQMETDAGEWTVVKRRNRKSKVANDNAVVLSSLGDPVSMVGIDVDPLCGVTTRSGIRRSGDLARSKGLKALAPMYLC